jgi:16S rRNA (cytidine1402-2'-O)-methyltransferase
MADALEPGLYLVATPIGSARDITLRALDVLAAADVLLAEDTRNSRRLMEIHGIRLGERPLWPYHDHNGEKQRPRVLATLDDGKSVALVSDAGTPLIADPGFTLARAAIAEGHKVFAVPGASAVLSALSVSGLPTDRFLFAGFPPSKGTARKAFLTELANVPATLVFYESPRRLADSLRDMSETLGADRDVAVSRELTKKFEETRRGTLGELAGAYEIEPAPKGEIVITIGPPKRREADPDDVDALLREALATESVKDAATIVAQTLGIPRKQAYARALQLTGKE